jgi:hypothetical protein
MTLSSGNAASPPRMRPYAGVGLVVFATPVGETDGLNVPLYEEPGLSRVGVLKSSRLPGNEWVFGLREIDLPLIVAARNGRWLRVIYDDAGREAWLDPQRKGTFQTWEQFLKRHPGRMLPGLQSPYYQIFQQPGGKQLGTVTPKHLFKILKIENSWTMVLVEQSRIGWLRWRDDDGRLLVGF